MRLGFLLLVWFVCWVGCAQPPEGRGDDAASPDGGVDAPDVIRFGDLRTEEIAARRAVVRFTTETPTSCEVDFGTAAQTLDQTATDPSMAQGELSTDHEVPLEDLVPATTYFWRGRVVDADGQMALTEVLSFTTLGDDATTGLQNFALGAAVVEVSSTFGGGGDDSTWGANKAFDGRMATEWATDGDGDAAHVTVDFGFVRKVTHFAFRSREMADGTSIVTQVQLRFDGGEPVGPFDTPDPDVRYEFRLEQGVAAQTATLEAVETTGGNTGAREVEFIGTPKE